MITPAFGLTATERVLPKLALDFTTAVLDSRITFTRTTGASNPATYVGSNGYVTAATNNQPRFDYDPVALTCKGLLIEEPRSNLVLYAQDFSNAAWTRTNATIGTSTTSPDGTANGQFLAETVTNGLHRTFVTASISVANATAHTLSVFVKANGRNYIRLGDGNVAGSECFFNISNGTVFSTGAAATATSVQSFGNGWYKCSITYTTTSLLAAPAIFISTNGSTISYPGDVTKGVYLYGAQIEAGAFATSYIPTTSAALTRNADVATMAGTNFSSWFNASEGSFVVQTIPMASNSDIARGITVASDASNLMALWKNTSGNATARITTLGSNVMSENMSAWTSGAKVALTYKLNSSVAAINGGAAFVDNAVTIPTVNTLYLGASNTATQFVNGHMVGLRYWPQRLTDTETRSFSK